MNSSVTIAVSFILKSYTLTYLTHFTPTPKPFTFHLICLRPNTRETIAHCAQICLHILFFVKLIVFPLKILNMEHTATTEPPNDPKTNAEEADESQDICRTCLTLTDELRSIYRRGQICGQITRLADMLADCTKLEVFYYVTFNLKPYNR